MHPLDSPEFASRVYFPRKTGRITPPGARDFDIPVGKDTTLGARLYVSDPKFRVVLFFHGNGETIEDYDEIARLYQAAELNLFVVDYRGYGWSTGRPTLRDLADDPPQVAEYFLTQVKPAFSRESPAPIIMGRSLGSSPATDIALRYGDRFSGLVLESGFADVRPLFKLLGLQLDEKDDREADALFSNYRKLKNITIPVLLLHGEDDLLIPASHARMNFESVSHKNKALEIFPGSGHNDLMFRNQKNYFKKLKEFSSRS